MTIDTPTALFFDQLRDLLSVESQLVPAMPELVDAATNTGLKDLLRQHHEETLHQKKRIQAILDRHGIGGRDDTSKAMAGLIEGGSEHLSMVEGGDVRDMLLIAHCSRIEAYEIAAYRFAGSLAGYLELEEESELLGESLAEEVRAMEKLARIPIGKFSAGGFFQNQDVLAPDPARR